LPGKKEERRLELSRETAAERDTDRLVDIVDQVNRMLYEKEQRRKEERKQNPSAA